MRKVNIPVSFWAAMTVVALLFVLFFGLRPKDLPSSNPVRIHPTEGMIAFDTYGIAYAEIDPSNNWQIPGRPEALTIEMAVRAYDTNRPGFKSLLMVHDGEDRNQLIVGQWKSSIILMNGDDYDNRRRFPKLSVKDVFDKEKVQFVTIVAGNGATKLYLNGDYAGSNSHWQLRIPGRGEKSAMVVGNSVTGKQTWTGELFGLALYESRLSGVQVRGHYDTWKRQRHFPVDHEKIPLVVYTFDALQQNRILDRSGHNIHLQLPSRPTVLKKSFLALSLRDFPSGRLFFMDAVFNWIGFIPLSAFLFGWLSVSNAGRSSYLFVATVLFCFSLSLCMEIAQAWMPTRSSSLLDLLLNTLGALTGIWLFNEHCRRNFMPVDRN